MRTRIILVIILLPTLCLFAKSSKIDPYCIHVLAKGNIFSVANGDKVSLETAILTHAEIRNFLDSTGAINVRKTFPHFNQAETLYINYEGDTVRLIDLSQYYIVEFRDSTNWLDLKNAWKGTDSLTILGQETYDEICKIEPNDYWFQDQWHLTTGENDEYQNSPSFDSAWVFTTGNENVLVGIIDGGFDTSHFDLSGRVVGGVNLTSGSNPFDISDDQSSEGQGPGNHGTRVAGVISANTNNDGLGVAGIDWLNNLFVIKAAKDDQLQSSAIDEGIDYLRSEGCHIINMSVGKYPTTWEMVNPFSNNARAAACYNAWIQGIMLVAAKGNDNCTDFFIPSDLITVLAVGASAFNANVKAGFSNYGPNLDILAPGEGLLTTWRNGLIGPFSGTSGATPVVCGLASLIKSYNFNFDADEIEQIIKMTAYDAYAPGWDEYSGYGIIRANSSLEFAAGHIFVRLEGLDPSMTQVGDAVQMVFKNNGGLATGVHLAEKYEVTYHFEYPEYEFVTAPSILFRNRVSQGWSQANPNDEMPYMEIVTGSLTTSSCDIRTYAYHLTNILGQDLGWWPCEDPPCSEGEGPDVMARITVAGIPGDSDNDGIANYLDDCPDDPYNDSDGDGYCGNVDNCPDNYNPNQDDNDNDNVGDVCDNCPNNYNPNQEDFDADDVGDICDNCADDFNPDQADDDSDGFGNACDICPGFDDNEDFDYDGIPDGCDNCPYDFNPDQDIAACQCNSGDETEWTKTYGGLYTDMAYALLTTTDTGYVIAGTSNSFDEENDNQAFIKKADECGRHVWRNSFGGWADERCYDIQHTSEGGYMLTGQAHMPLNGKNARVIVTDDSGQVLWSQEYKHNVSPAYYDDIAYAGREVFTGSCIIAGTTKNNPSHPGNMDAWIASVGPGGIGSSWALGEGDDIDELYAMTKTANGNFIAVGKQDPISPAAYTKIYVLCVNSSCNINWDFTIGQMEKCFEAYAVDTTGDGGFIIAGCRWEPDFDNQKDFYVAKYDSQHTKEWDKTYGGPDNEIAYSVRQAPDNGYIISGSTESFGAGALDYYVVRIDNDGDTLWTKTFGGSENDIARDVHATADTGFIIGGYSNSFGAGGYDFYAVKIGPQPYYICGDANGDGIINMLDITYINNYLYKNGPPPYPLESADANCDGDLNILDVTYLINYLYKEGPAPCANCD